MLCFLLFWRRRDRRKDHLVGICARVVVRRLGIFTLLFRYRLLRRMSKLGLGRLVSGDAFCVFLRDFDEKLGLNVVELRVHLLVLFYA